MAGLLYGSGMRLLECLRLRIKDVDVAEETAELTKHNILMQAGISVLGHANSTNAAAIKLLG